MTERCAWFEPLRKCCLAISNEVKEAQQREVNEMLMRASTEWMKTARKAQDKINAEIMELCPDLKGIKT